MWPGSFRILICICVLIVAFLLHELKYSSSSILTKSSSINDVNAAAIEEALAASPHNKMNPFSTPYREQYTIEELKIRHPHCFSDYLFKGTSNTNGHKRELFLNSVAKWKLIGRNVTSSVHYNHLCQYIMKDRYNCARNCSDIVEYGESPTDWKLTLIPKQDSDNGECNLWNFVHELGGPAGVAKTLEQFGKLKRTMYTQDNDANRSDNHKFGGETKTSVKEQQKRPFNVLMMGNSYLRQTFEALACGWSGSISDYRASINSIACYSLKCGNDHSGEQKFALKDIGDFLAPRIYKGPAKSFIHKRKFYRPGVALPKKVFGKTVKDDLAMVEFENLIRFYFVFRPHTHKNLTGVFDQLLDLDPANVDVLIFNSEEDEYIANEQKRLKQIFTSTGVWQARSFWPFKQFERLQKRDIGRWFGADNPWIYVVPDDHSCMPGPVDDMANLLMFSIFSNATITSNATIAKPLIP